MTLLTLLYNNQVLNALEVLLDVKIVLNIQQYTMIDIVNLYIP